MALRIIKTILSSGLLVLFLVGTLLRISFMITDDNQGQLRRLTLSSSCNKMLGSAETMNHGDGCPVATTTSSRDDLVSTFAHIREKAVCFSGGSMSDLDIWQYLCQHSLMQRFDQHLLQGKEAKIVQIGAHYGFEHNDPMAQGLGKYLELLSNTTQNNERQRFQWTFIEASPSNFAELQKNLRIYNYLCDMVGIHAGIVPDGKEQESLVFYAIRDTIDGETGYDSLSGKTVPFWISQISSFNKRTLMSHAGIFSRAGLDINNYVVEVNVTAKSYSTIMAEIVGEPSGGGNQPDPPIFVMIDTEGFDCDILLGIAENSPYWPEFLIFEHAHCRAAAYKKVKEKMERLGYWVYRQPKRRQQNTLAIRIHNTTSTKK